MLFLPTAQRVRGSLDALPEYVASCDLPTPWAVFQLNIFVDPSSGKEHLAVMLGDPGDDAPMLARVHSECLTGDALFSQRCGCGAQLEAALRAIAAEGRGVLLYLRQQGRGIGLVNKIRAYQLQQQGLDTVDANEHLGSAADERTYDVVRPMLDHFRISRLRLMTNNPRKIDGGRQHRRACAAGRRSPTAEPALPGDQSHAPGASIRYTRFFERRGCAAIGMLENGSTIAYDRPPPCPTRERRKIESVLPIFAIGTWSPLSTLWRSTFTHGCASLIGAKTSRARRRRLYASRRITVRGQREEVLQ